MTSLTTNASAMVALQALQQVNRDLNMANERIATGLKINDAGDNATYWSIAATARSDNSALSGVKDALAAGQSSVGVTYEALDAVRAHLEDVKDLLISARQSGLDRTSIQTELTGKVADMQAIVKNARVQNSNLLSVDSSVTGYNSVRSFVSGVTRVGTAVTVSKIDVDEAKLAMIDANGTAASKTGILDKQRTGTKTVLELTGTTVSALTDSAADMTTLEEYISTFDSALQDTIKAQSTAGIALNRMESQSEFIDALEAANDKAISNIVDANMEEESTRLRALQTQQQLAVQSLSIANSSSQVILGLFR